MKLFFFIFIFLYTASGNSILPNDPVTTIFWIIAIGWCFCPLLMGTRKQHKKRNMEDAEWYISNYKAVWFSGDRNRRFEAISHGRAQSRLSDKRDSYRGRKYIDLYDDLWENYQREVQGKSLKDTYASTFGWMAICNPNIKDMYCPQYFNVVNDEEKLKNWEPSMKINMG